MKHTEIEIQVKIQNAEPLMAFLQKEADFVSESRQIDEYFTPPHRDFLAVRPIKEWLRLRSENGRNSITYKNWHYQADGRSYHADEFESTVENFESLKKLFAALNMRPLAVVDKLRKKWNYQDYEIALDEVKNLGDFVEIEYRGGGEVADTKKIYSEMVEFLKSLGCGKIERNNGGYPFLILFPEEAEYQEI